MGISFAVSEESVIALFLFFGNINFAGGLKKAVLKKFRETLKKNTCAIVSGLQLY